MSIISFAHSNNCLIIAQDKLNMNFTKQLIDENSKTKNISNNINIIFFKSFALNSNLQNMENLDGVYLPKGITSYTGILFYLSKNVINVTIQPEKTQFLIFPQQNLPEKQGTFRYLNDTRRDERYINYINLKNIGLTLKINKFRFGYGNWNLWWGPGIHNSLILSNNSQGFNHFFLSYENNNIFNKDFQINYKYLSSENFKNIIGNNFSQIYSMLELNYKNIQLGLNYNYLLGGYENYDGNPHSMLLINKNDTRVTAKKSAYYIMYNNKNTGLKIFYEFGFPNRLGFERGRNLRYENYIVSNLGMRKKELFGIKQLIFGIEYTRLVQGSYYNLQPTPNWYQLIENNYYTYNGMRIGAHSGTDSDDFLLYSGIIKKIIALSLQLIMRGMV